MLPPDSPFFDLGHEPSQKHSFRCSQILLFVFVQEKQEMNAFLASKKQIKIAVSAPFAFSTGRIGASSLSDSP